MAIKVKYRCPVENCICQVLSLESEDALADYRSRLTPCVFHPEKMMEIVEDIELPWIVEIGNNDQFWYKEVELLPAIIAHEYWRFRELCKTNQPYAAYFQARDVIEVILKFEVLSVCAWANSVGDDEFRKQVACEITKQNISLGDWRELANRIKSYYTANPADMPSALWQGLCKTREEYFDSKKELIKWRNENIGHGALGFAEDEEFKVKLENVIMSIRGVLNRVGKHLQEQYLKMGSQPLMGSDNIRKLSGKHPITMVTKLKDESDYSFSLEPYIALRGNGIFFFDTQFGPTYSELQCYTNGHRPNVTIPEFIELYHINAKHNPKYKIYEASETRSVAANDRTADDDYFLSFDIGDKGSVKPDAVLNWLSQQIKNNTRGVYRILMPRAAGKSTLAERLNMINGNPWIVDDTADVRTYHIGRTQLRGIDDLLNEIEELWCEAHPGDRNRWKPNKHLVEMMHDNHLSASEAIVTFMREYVNCGICKKQKVVLVIDGLDEITSGNKKIWEMIPAPDMLFDGMHIVCLGREPSELSRESGLAKSYQAQLNVQQITSELLINTEDPAYIDFLKTYLKSQNLPNIIDPDLLIKKADHRILYLVLLSSMIRDGMTPEMIGNSLSIVRKYLSVLDAKYGEKQGVRLRELLAVLATLGMREPLSMRELSYLTTGSCNAEISYALIGMMRDIFPLLSTSRGYISQGTVLTGVNRFAFHDKDIASAVLQIVDDNVVPTIERMICFSISMAEKGAIILNESENACFVVFAYFDYLLGYLKGNRTKYENGNTLGLICHYISLCESYTQHVSALHRQWLAMEYCISAYDKQKKTNPSSFNIRISDNESFSGSSALAYIYKTYAGILERNLQSAKAEQYYVKAMELLRKSISRDIPASLLKLRYNVYTRCANVFAANENRDPNDAIAVSELAVEAMKALGEHPKDSDAQALASAMQNLGQKHRVAGHIDKSIECYEDALSLLSGIDPLVRDEQIYATTLMNYGVALREKHQYDKAIESYKKSIEIFEKLCDEGTEQHKALLVQPYNNIAYCYREYAKASNLDTQLLLQAKLYYEKLLAVLQLLCNCGYMMDIHNQQGSAFGNYAVVLMLLKENDYAKQYFKKALDEYEAVMEQGTPLYQNGLAAACVNYQSILEPEHDCSELRRIQKIQQKLLPAGGHWQVTSSTAESEAHKRNSENSYQSTRAPSGEQPQGNHAKQIAFSTDEASINAYMSKLPQSMQGARPIGILADGSAMFKLPDSYNRIIKLEQKLRNQDYRVGGDVFVWTGYKLFEELNRKMEQSGSAKARMRSNVSILWDYINNAKADIDATQDKQAIIELKCKRITLIELLLIMSDMPEYANCDTAQSIDIVSLTECLLSDLRDIETLCINRGILATGYCLAAKVYSSRMITAEAEKYEKIAVEYEHHSRNHKDENEQISAIFAVPIQNFEPMLSQEPFSMLAHAYIALEENLTKSIASNCKTPSSCEIKAAAEIYQSISSLSSSSEYEKLAASHLWASKLVRFGDSRDIDLTIELETKVLKQVESLGLISSNEILFIEMVYDYLAIAHYHKGNPRAARDCISKAKQLSRKYTPWFAQ